jgi:hypothetical protein
MIGGEPALPADEPLVLAAADRLADQVGHAFVP